MAKSILGAALALVLTACGGGGDSSPSAPPAAEKPTQLVVIGNSLTVHPVLLSIGWDHVSGMAASDAAHDYAHLVGAGLGVPTVVANVADLERSPPPATNAALVATTTAPIDTHTALVVQLGDVAGPGGSADLTAGYKQLLDASVGALSLTCLSTWKQDDAKDAMMKAACEAHQGKFVFIGDILPTRTDVIPAGQDAGIAAHPHDPSMAVIAARILAAR